jgi:TolA protein
VEREPQLEPPNLLHRDRLDPGLVKAFAASAAVHVIILVALILAGSAAHHALKPATTYTVGLVDLDSGSALLDLGPLGDQVAPRENVFGAPTAAVSPPAVSAPPAVVKTLEPAPPPKPAPEAEAAPEPKPEPPAPKVEVKPEPKPEPPKVEAKKPEVKPAPKPEAKAPPKPEPKPEVKAKPEPKPKPEVKTTAKAESKPKPTTTTKAAEKPVAKPDAKATAAKSATAAAAAKTDPAAKPGAAASTTAQSGGGATIAKATPPGPGSGGGGGFGGTGPGGGPAGGELRSPEFVSYFEHIKRTIRRGWVWQTADPNIRTTVGFAVLGDGRLANIRSVEPSGDPRFDLSVLNAVRAAQGQLGPPPAQYQKDFSDVQIVFRPQDLAE